MPRRPTNPACDSETNAGSDYSPAEVEFLKAIDRYRRERRRPFPTWREVYRVLMGLGYRKDNAS